MQEHDENERGQAQSEDEQVICSNELLKAIRERMAKRRKQEKEDPRREEPD